MLGYIHSIESFGSVDGPGIRMVVFLQGCIMRCLYCHNPDTWKLNTGQKMSVHDILHEYEKNKEFYQNGGITVTGGEPLLQLDFLIDLFQECKTRKIHTCLDTSGITFHQDNSFFKQIDRLLQVTDLILVDIKHIDPIKHQELTGHSNENILSFIKYIDEKQIPFWIRHVVIPTITFNDTYLYQLGKWIASLKHMQALDILPYHIMGKEKYDFLKKEYPLEGIQPLSKEDAMKAKKVILLGMKDALK